MSHQHIDWLDFVVHTLIYHHTKAADVKVDHARQERQLEVVLMYAEMNAEMNAKQARRCQSAKVS